MDTTTNPVVRHRSLNDSPHCSKKKIRANEREACAEVCMSVSGKYIGVGAGASPWSFGVSEAASKCAKYIRARGKK